VPAWDFAVDGWLHSRMAVLRGVEGGFAVARAARGGRLTLSDDRGRILAEADSAAAEVASVLAPVPPGAGGTLHARLGDAFAWLCCAVLAGLLALALRREA
jgi:apolipoprotein N-acyltransferase